ncbi:hypothetical protein NQ318_001293 [Aromia moschata]|uniref:Transposase n=1 Tax=Aromia moschata TaxID=1265417 RepID=A0AAV8ZEG9_9CUCU|nr:hypothetical protein NQ318_001293 [Aromia moschata]
MTIYTLEERKQIIKWYYGHCTAAEIVIHKFDVMNIVHNIKLQIHNFNEVMNIVHKFDSSGYLHSCRKCNSEGDNEGRQINEEREERDIRVCSIAETKQSCSSRQISAEVDVPDRTVRAILKRNKYHCYNVAVTQEIFPDDYVRRMEFCKVMMEKANENETFIRNILFTDENSFAFHDRRNSSITRYWSQENKHLSVPLRTQYPQKVNVWTGILGDFIIGPFFIDGNLTARKYLNLLRNEIIPIVKALAINREEIWYQQDGCPAHNAREV